MARYEYDSLTDDIDAPLRDVSERVWSAKPREWRRSLMIVAVCAGASIGVLVTILFQDPS